MTGGRELAFVGDVHLDRDDPDLPDFLEALERVADRAAGIVFLGDLFNLWIGERNLELPHQTAVVERLERMRARGLRVAYVEGNRDYGIARGHLGSAFDRVAAEGLEERWGGKILYAAHGDLVNVDDRQYRMWRRFSRSAGCRVALRGIPAGMRLRLAERLEAALRSTNLRMKGSFPEARVREYAAPHLARGVDAVVLGHFHQEHRLEHGDPPSDRAVFVLPDWKSSRRYFRVTLDGEMGFASTAS